LKARHLNILNDRNSNILLPIIVFAELKYLISIKRINVDYEKALKYISNSENCMIYPINEAVVGEMPQGLSIHDALIVATGLVHQKILKEEVIILTEDEEIIDSNLLPVI
jgi:hypothetical protein